MAAQRPRAALRRAVEPGERAALRRARGERAALRRARGERAALRRARGERAALRRAPPRHREARSPQAEPAPRRPQPAAAPERPRLRAPPAGNQGAAVVSLGSTAVPPAGARCWRLAQWWRAGFGAAACAGRRDHPHRLSRTQKSAAPRQVRFVWSPRPGPFSGWESGYSYSYSSALARVTKPGQDPSSR